MVLGAEGCNRAICILRRTHIDPALPAIAGAILFILFIGFALRAVRQPQIVGYLLAGLVISLSSTAVVLKLLKDWNELGTQTGQNVLAVLLAQDIALIPMIIAINVMGGEQIGEFSFILAALAHTGQMLPDEDYRLIVAIIAISLMLSPAWIALCKALLGHPEGRPDHPRLS